jgi:hypothetical protein
MIHARRRLDPVLAEILSSIHKTADTIPPGYMTVSQWAAQWKLVHGQARIYILQAIHAGIMERKRFRSITKGRLILLDHYRHTRLSKKIKPLRS